MDTSQLIAEINEMQNQRILAVLYDMTETFGVLHYDYGWSINELCLDMLDAFEQDNVSGHTSAFAENALLFNFICRMASGLPAPPTCAHPAPEDGCPACVGRPGSKTEGRTKHTQTPTPSMPH